MASTKITCAKTAGEIMQVLSRSGATKIMSEYEAMEAVGISFIVIREKELAFKLPIRWKPVLKAMMDDKKTPSHLCHNDQAKRVAWRQVLRWIEAQMALINTGMANIEEVFMPYLLISPTETLYEKLAENKFKQIE